MGQVRIEKLQELIGQEFSKLLMNGVKDPRIGFVTVTGVKMTGDLREAKIFVSIMGDKESIKNSLNGLRHSLGFIRREIGQRIRLKYTPELSVELDTQIEKNKHIDELFYQIEKEAKSNETDARTNV